MTIQERRNLWGARLRQLRQARGLTFRQLSAQCGLSATFLNKIEKGGSNLPSAAKIRVLAKILGTDESELLALAGHLDLYEMQATLRDAKEFLVTGEKDRLHLLGRIIRAENCLQNVFHYQDEIAVRGDS